MDLYAISSTALGMNSSIGRLFTNYVYNKIMSWRLKRRLHGIILLKGVSTLCEKHSSNNILFLDIDKLFNELTAPKDATEANKAPSVLDSYMAYPIIRNHLYSISRCFKKNIVCVSHNIELLNALSIPTENTWFYAFSKEMDQRTGPLFPDEKAHADSIVSKLRIRDQFEEDHVIIVESMADLDVKIKIRFNINSSEI